MSPEKSSPCASTTEFTNYNGQNYYSVEPPLFSHQCKKADKKKEGYGECKAEVNDGNRVIGSVKFWEG